MSEPSQHQQDNGVMTTINQMIDTNINSNMTNINTRKRKFSVMEEKVMIRGLAPLESKQVSFFHVCDNVVVKTSMMHSNSHCICTNPIADIFGCPYAF